MLEGKGKPDEWKTREFVSIFRGKGDWRNWNAYRGVELKDHAMKTVEIVQERRIRIVFLNFFMPWPTVMK